MSGEFSELNSWLDRYLTPAIKKIIIINVAVTLFYMIASSVAYNQVTGFYLTILGQNPSLSIQHGFIWQFVTYMWVHVSFGHLFFNMLALFFLGATLEKRWGTREFWKFYLLTGIGAGVFHAIIALLTGSDESRSFIIGASGAIYGIMLAFAAYYPNMPIYIYGLIPIKAKWLIALLALTIFLSDEGGQATSVSHLTHLTGLLVGYLLLVHRHRVWDIRRLQYSSR